MYVIFNNLKISLNIELLGGKNEFKKLKKRRIRQRKTNKIKTNILLLKFL